MPIASRSVAGAGQPGALMGLDRSDDHRSVANGSALPRTATESATMINCGSRGSCSGWVRRGRLGHSASGREAQEESESATSSGAGIEFVRLTDVPLSAVMRLLNEPRIARHMPLAGAFSEASAAEWAQQKDRQSAVNGYGPLAIL